MPARTNKRLARQAAQSFLRLAKQYGFSQTKLAALVGEAPQNFSVAVRCVRGGSLERVYRWVQAWEKAGHPKLRLVIEADDAWVEHAPEQPGYC